MTTRVYYNTELPKLYRVEYYPLKTGVPINHGVPVREV